MLPELRAAFGVGLAVLAGAFESLFGATRELGRCLAIGKTSAVTWPVVEVRP